jgi:two-component system nitrate/nitrite response regulator NarL
VVSIALNATARARVMSDGSALADLHEARTLLRVALVHDDPVVRSMLAWTLQNAFQCVGQAGDADSAIALVEAQTPDLVLLASDLPGDTMRATQEIRARAPSTATVLIFSDEAREKIVGLINTGDVAYLRAGIDEPTLIATLVASVRAHHALGIAGAHRTTAEPGQTSRVLAAPPDLRLIDSLEESETSVAWRVAIADDDPLARRAIQAQLEGVRGLTFVGAAASVDEIVYLAALKGADTVLLDWQMPDGGGPKAAERILGREPHTCIIGLTSSDDQEAVLEMSDAGACCVLIKGVAGEELVHAISRIHAAAA